MPQVTENTCIWPTERRDEPAALDVGQLRRYSRHLHGTGDVGRLEMKADVDITVEELKARLDRGDELLLLDVREPYETSICSLPDSTLVPMAELPRRLGDLDRGRDLVVYCRSGHRSLHAVAFLRRQGYHRAVNLKGGILEWIDKVDPSQMKY